MFGKSSKQSVQLSASPSPGSRIRRDAPQTASPAIEPKGRDNDALTVIVGIIMFEVAIFVIILGFANYFV